MTDFYFTPELHLRDGRIIRDLDDAASFTREQEVRPAHAAAHCFVRWLEELDILE
jgi:hypothetical protein